MTKEELIKRLSLLEAEAKNLGVEIKIALKSADELTEKPKLRHGDFGYTENDRDRIVLYQNGTLQNGTPAGRRDDYCPTGIVSNSDIIVLGNVFDLLKEWSEPFVKWESKPAYNGSIQIIIEVVESGVFFGNSGNGATFELEDITKIWHKLGHAIVELKRKENK